MNGPFTEALAQAAHAAGQADVLTSVEAAAFLRVHVVTLHLKCKAGEIPHGKVGRTYRFSRRALEAWLSKAGAE